MLFAFMWASVGELSYDEPMPPLRSSDLPLLALGIPDHEIVLDKSLCDLSVADDNPFKPGLQQVERLNVTDRFLGEWL